MKTQFLILIALAVGCVQPRPEHGEAASIQLTPTVQPARWIELASNDASDIRLAPLVRSLEERGEGPIIFSLSREDADALARALHERWRSAYGEPPGGIVIAFEEDYYTVLMTA